MSTLTKKITHKKRLLITAGILLVFAAFWMLQSRPASAEGSDLELVEGHYPIVEGSRIDSCSLCHSSVPSLNPFGQAYSSNGRNNAALTAIQGADSDGDGFTNLQEINALTFPGNANDHPAQASTNTPTATATATRTPTVTRTGTVEATASLTPTLRPTTFPGSTDPLKIFLPLINNLQSTP